MNLPLSLHISIHIILSILAGFIVWKVWKKPAASFISALISGVAVDFDHFIDYYLAFGWNFNLYYFKQGFEFLRSDKMYTLFHGWEYVIMLLLAVLIFRAKAVKTVFLALALGLFFHLSADVIIDGMPAKSYLIIYKIKNNFDIEKLVTPELWEKHQRERETFGFK